MTSLREPRRVGDRPELSKGPCKHLVPLLTSRTTHFARIYTGFPSPCQSSGGPVHTLVVLCLLVIFASSSLILLLVPPVAVHVLRIDCVTELRKLAISVAHPA